MGCTMPARGKGAHKPHSEEKQAAAWPTSFQLPAGISLTRPDTLAPGEASGGQLTSSDGDCF